MSGYLSGRWGWLTGRASDPCTAIRRMREHFEEPEKFWEHVQATIREAGGSMPTTDAAARDIEEWFAGPYPKGKFDPWQAAIQEAVDDAIVTASDADTLAKTAKRYRESVLDLLPAVLRNYRDTLRAASGTQAENSEQVQVRDTLHNIGPAGVNWRFFGDPAIQQRNVVHFPVVAVSNPTSPSEACGRVLDMRIEVIEPGTGNVVPHPLLGLAGLDASVATAFQRHAENALHAATQLVKGGPDPRATAAFHCPEFVRLGNVNLDGSSAGGAFALAFERALRGSNYDQRVLVISKADADGNLSAVDNPRMEGILGLEVKSVRESEKTSLRLKAQGICEYNRTKKPDDPKRIDTIAVVRDQWKDMHDAIDLFTFDDPPEVVAIEDFEP